MHRRKLIYHFRAVGFVEDDGRWCALCLETSFMGYGTTFVEALADLVRATETAIEFTHRKDWPDSSMGGPASRRYWAMYERAIANLGRPSATFQAEARRAA